MRRHLIGLIAVLLIVICTVPTAVMESGTSLPTADNAEDTAVIDNSTDLEDGIYAPDGFTWAGGTGRLKGMECTQIAVREGMTYATIVLRSGKYSYLKANGSIFPCEMTSSTSTAEIPVRLNVSNQIRGCTLAMTAPHEVEYSICVELDAAKNGSDDSVTVGGITFEPDPEAGTQLMRIYHAETADVIYVEGVGYYFICDDEDSIPSGVKNEAEVIIRPVSCAYVAIPKLVDRLLNSGATGIGMISENISNNLLLQEAVENGTIGIAGRIEEADFKKLVIGGCDLAVADNAEISDDVQAYFRTLGIPLFRDRSAEESDEDSGKWLAAYQLIFGVEEDAA